ncbi:MAG: hypothetical protein AB7E13_00710 [Arcobacteraceae bacterium]|jgi:hypothetical protein
MNLKIQLNKTPYNLFLFHREIGADVLRGGDSELELKVQTQGKNTVINCKRATLKQLFMLRWLLPLLLGFVSLVGFIFTFELSILSPIALILGSFFLGLMCYSLINDNPTILAAFAIPALMITLWAGMTGRFSRSLSLAQIDAHIYVLFSVLILILVYFDFWNVRTGETKYYEIIDWNVRPHKFYGRFIRIVGCINEK